jgi:hypothetical protein
MVWASGPIVGAPGDRSPVPASPSFPPDAEPERPRRTSRSCSSEEEELAVADHFIASVSMMNQRVSGRILNPDKVELFTLDRADVLTTEQSKQLHAPLITPLSSCERTQHRPLPVTRKWPIVLVGRQGLEPWTR